MNLRRQAVRSEAGFSLLNVLVAMTLMAIGVVALSSSGMFVMGAQTESSLRATATSIAVSYMEQVKRRPTLASESPVQVDEAGDAAAAGKYTRTLTVVDEPSVANGKRVTVDVQYPTGWGRIRKVELVTIVFDNS